MPIIFDEAAVSPRVGMASAALAPAVIFKNSRRLTSDGMDCSLVIPLYADWLVEEMKPAFLAPERIDPLHRADLFSGRISTSALPQYPASMMPRRGVRGKEVKVAARLQSLHTPRRA